MLLSHNETPVQYSLTKNALFVGSFMFFIKMLERKLSSPGFARPEEWCFQEDTRRK